MSPKLIRPQCVGIDLRPLAVCFVMWSLCSSTWAWAPLGGGVEEVQLGAGIDKTATSEPDELIEVTAAQEASGDRLDRFLAAQIEDLSRSRLQTLIADGQVSENGRTISDRGSRVKPGAVYAVRVPPPEPPEPAAEAIALNVVFEDDELIVIDKPAGLVVHPSAGHASGTLVNALIAHCGERLSGVGGVKRPGIVHRLDKDTSGLLVVAKSDVAHRGLSAQFAAHGRDGRMSRAYKAVCWGVPLLPKGSVDAALGRAKLNRMKMAVVKDVLGRHAVTHYEVERAFSRGAQKEGIACLMRLQLETGRTHQIRVHMMHIGHPLLGDPLYGAGFRSRELHLTDAAAQALATLKGQALHACELGFEHPVSKERLLFTSELPDNLANLVSALELESCEE